LSPTHGRFELRLIDACCVPLFSCWIAPLVWTLVMVGKDAPRGARASPLTLRAFQWGCATRKLKPRCNLIVDSWPWHELETSRRGDDRQALTFYMHMHVE
jgi:hypothetical protein